MPRIGVNSPLLGGPEYPLKLDYLLTLVRRMFHLIQVFMPTVKLLTDEQLKELGVKRVGKRAELRRKCKESEHGTVYINVLNP